jgi:dihydrolipoamide dehydrogenase
MGSVQCSTKRPLKAPSPAAMGGPKSRPGTPGLSTLCRSGQGRVIEGACLFGPGMDHIAHLFAWAIELSKTASALLQLPFYHPMFEEGLKTALREICEAVGSPGLQDMDFVAAPGA